jgi:hypothetical protein
MPLGSESTLGLAGPNGTPLIAELPAPADPAGGVSCAKARAGKIRLPSAKARTSAELRDICLSRNCTFNDDLGRAFPLRFNIHGAGGFWGVSALAHVSYGSNPTEMCCSCNVRFPLESNRLADIPVRQLRAKSGQMCPGAATIS